MKSKKFRKWISCVTAVGVFAACGAGFANEAVQISEDPFGAVVSVDFEENGVENYGFDYVSGGISVKKADDSHGNVLYAEATESTSTRAYIELDEPIKEGVIYATYEVKNTSMDIYNYTAFNTVPRANATTAHDYLKTFTFQKNGKFGHFYGMDAAWSIDQNTVSEYEADKWYKIDQWIDLDRRTIDFYVDNELFASQSLPDHAKEIHSFYITQDRQSSGGSYWDNLALYRLNSDMAFKFKSDGLNFPERFASYLDIRFGAEAGGHIFADGENVKFDITAGNISGSDKSFSAEYEVRDEMNNVLWSEKDNVSVAKDSETTKTVNINIGKKYGFFSINAIYTDLATGNINNKDNTEKV